MKRIVVESWSKTGRGSRWRPSWGCAPLLTPKICELAEWRADMIASWRMKTAINHPREEVNPVRGQQQEMLDLHGAVRWQEFPGPDRDACLQALARLLHQTITRQPAKDENER